MSTNFPTSVDVFTNPGATDPLTNPPHHTQHTNLNDAVLAIETYLLTTMKGMIVMWSGTIATIPTGWALCDGTLGTPDLRDKFVVGARQDVGGVAKSNLEGSLNQSGGLTGHSHSAHANLTHAGMTIGDHTGLTHNAIADHASAADISVPSQAIASGADLSIPSQAIASGTDISIPSQGIASGADISVPSQAIASGVDISAPSRTVSITTVAYSKGGTASNIVGALSGSEAAATYSRPSLAVAAVTGSRPSLAVAAATGSRPSLAVAAATGSRPSLAVAAVTGSRPALTHNAISDHGAAGTLTHSFSEPNDHAISAHDTVSHVNPYYALAFIMKVAV